MERDAALVPGRIIDRKRPGGERPGFGRFGFDFGFGGGRPYMRASKLFERFMTRILITSALPYINGI